MAFKAVLAVRYFHSVIKGDAAVLAYGLASLTFKTIRRFSKGISKQLPKQSKQLPKQRVILCTFARQPYCVPLFVRRASKRIMLISTKNGVFISVAQ